MEVLNERVAFLSNYEVHCLTHTQRHHTDNNVPFAQVYTVLKEVKSPKANVATIIYEVILVHW